MYHHSASHQTPSSVKLPATVHARARGLRVLLTATARATESMKVAPANDVTPLSVEGRLDALESDNKALKAELAEMHQQASSLGGPVDITQDGMSNDVDDALRTPYSMGVGVLLGEDASLFLRVSSVLLQVVLMIAQVTLAFGFLDCSQLFALRGNLPMYATPINMQNFYEPEGRIGQGDHAQPAITVATAMIAVPVLALTFRAAAEGTMYSAYPIEYVLFLARRPSRYVHVCITAYACMHECLYIYGRMHA